MSSIIGPYASVEATTAGSGSPSRSAPTAGRAPRSCSTAAPHGAQPSRPPPSTGTAGECGGPWPSVRSQARGEEPPVLSAVPAMMNGVPPVIDTEARWSAEPQSSTGWRVSSVCTGPGSPGGPTRERAVLLSGDAGVGKTRLLAELRTRAEDAGYRVLVGHCLDFGDSALPYLPFSEAFGRLAAEAPTLARSLVEAGPAHRPADAGPPRDARADLPATSRGPDTRPDDLDQPPRPAGPLRLGARRARAARPGRRRCCCSSRTSTGPTAPAARCSASCSPGASRSRCPSWRPTAATTCTAGTRCAERPPSGRGCPA